MMMQQHQAMQARMMIPQGFQLSSAQGFALHPGMQVNPQLMQQDQAMQLQARTQQQAAAAAAHGGVPPQGGAPVPTVGTPPGTK